MTQAIVKINDLNDLGLRIRTLGYPSMGESCMITLLEGARELCNVFIDSYESDDYSHWHSVLDKETRIDAFIWTHPDDDHSRGIQTLLSDFDPEKKAEIFIPTSLTSGMLEANDKKEGLASYNYLKDTYNDGQKYNWHEVSVDKGEVRYLFSRKIIDNKSGFVLDLKIGFLLPNGAVVNRRVDKDKMNSGEMNDLSLLSVIELNKARYIFAGDLARQNIQFLDDDMLRDFRFVKIPHHGSKEPVKFIDKIQRLPLGESHSVTTTFRSTHPYDEILNEYEKKCNSVYSTGRGNNQYGMVEIIYNIADINLCRVTLEGNAELVRPNSKT